VKPPPPLAPGTHVVARDGTEYVVTGVITTLRRAHGKEEARALRKAEKKARKAKPVAYDEVSPVPEATWQDLGRPEDAAVQTIRARDWRFDLDGDVAVKTKAEIFWKDPGRA
jgi:hypothetical protein